MSVDGIGTTANSMAIVAEAQTAVKKQKKPEQKTFQDDTVAIGKNNAIDTTQVKWPPLLPIGIRRKSTN